MFVPSHFWTPDAKFDNNAACAIIAKCGKYFMYVHIYVPCSKVLRWNFFDISDVYTKWCAETFPPIFGLFTIFDPNFPKIVAPPSNGMQTI